MAMLYPGCFLTSAPAASRTRWSPAPETARAHPATHHLHSWEHLCAGLQGPERQARAVFKFPWTMPMQRSTKGTLKDFGKESGHSWVRGFGPHHPWGGIPYQCLLCSHSAAHGETRHPWLPDTHHLREDTIVTHVQICKLFRHFISFPSFTKPPCPGDTSHTGPGILKSVQKFWKYHRIKCIFFFSTLQFVSSLAQAEHLCTQMKKFIPLGMPQKCSPTLLFNYTLRKIQVL